MIERQEIHCHNCGQYVQFDIDTELNGNHILNCPKCGHEHCRVVIDGKITDERWAQRNGVQFTNYITVNTSSITMSPTSTYTSYSAGTTDSSTGGSFLYQAWSNTHTGS